MAELALGIVGAIAAPDLCIQYGKRLLKVCAAFRKAESELDERILSVEASWMQTALELDFVKTVEHVMTADHLTMHYRILDVVLAKLKAVITILQGLFKNPTKVFESETLENIKLVMKKTKYVMVKSSLFEAIDELEQWQRRLESSLYLIMRMMNIAIDMELVLPRPQVGQATFSDKIPSATAIRLGLRDERWGEVAPIFRKRSELETMAKTTLPFCDAVLGQRAGSSKQLILDQITCSPGCNVDIVKKDVRDLARKLQHKSPLTFGLLICKGAIKDEIRTGPLVEPIFTLVFEKPDGLADPRSLRHLLIAGSAPHSMSEKLDIARELAQSVSYVHTFGFVHKNIRPETVLTLADEKTAKRSTFLVGFDNFRREDGRTYLRNEGDWTNDLYRHPNRQGIKPVEDYKMQHDIYSLGICLLEIGLWRSLVGYELDSQIPIPSKGLGLKEDDIHVEDLAGLKEKLVAMAQSELPGRMGTRYAQVVHTCLTCLDKNNDDFGRESEFQDEDGIRIGVRYIEKVLLRLGSICV